jgi:hypothetical protein
MQRRMVARSGAAQSDMQPETQELSSYLSDVLHRCLDMRAVWSIGHNEEDRDPSSRALLAFADRPTLEILRKSDSLHRPEVELLVVLDGDRFENAWGRQRLSGSLARWAWRPVTPDLAYYDESRWAARSANPGSVVRVRRKAFLLWRAR